LDEWEIGDRPPDKRELEAAQVLRVFFDENRERVFFSRQVEVQFEDQFFHWITNRAIRGLVEEGFLVSEQRKLATGGALHAVWNKRYRYPRREVGKMIGLVEEYADPNVAGAIGLNGELLVLEGFARKQFLMRGRSTNSHGDRAWAVTAHDLDFVFERDGASYGVEVKNMLGYMDRDELEVKLNMCAHLDLRPLIVARMLPKAWIRDIVQAGGYAMILKYQLYPISHKELAKRVAKELGLPVDAPKALADGTMVRFVRWHEQNT
jgi:hypothetical protein